MRRRARGVVLVALLGMGGGCDPGTEFRDVSLDPQLPPDDPEARADLAVLRYEVWPAASGICDELVAWASTCGTSCPPAPGLEGGAIDAASVAKGEDGSWPAAQLELPKGTGEVDVLVRGEDEGSTRFLHGCAAVDFAQRGVVPVRLARAWCDATTCETCSEVDCDLLPDDPQELVDPVCVPLDCGPDAGCCDGACQDFAHDPDHCGDCGVDCGIDNTCLSGRCIGCFFCLANAGQQCDEEGWCRCGDGVACGISEHCCDGACADILIDPEHCGSCETPCAEGQTCANGSCS